MNLVKSKWNAFAQMYTLLLQQTVQASLLYMLPFLQGRTLQIGCGAMLHGAVIKNMSLSYFATDLCEKMIQMAKAFNRQFDMNLQVANAQELPFPDNHFDSAVGNLVIHIPPCNKKILSQLKRVCKPDAKICLSVWGQSENCFIEKLINQTLSMSGLQKYVDKRQFHLSSKQKLKTLFSQFQMQPVHIQHVSTPFPFTSADTDSLLKFPILNKVLQEEPKQVGMKVRQSLRGILTHHQQSCQPLMFTVFMAVVKNTKK